MVYFDSHTHTNDLKLLEEIKEIDKICLEKKVYSNVVACDIIEFDITLKLVRDSKMKFATIGIHPTNCYDKNLNESINLIRDLVIKNPKVIAIGEIGLDYHYENTNKQIQMEFFKYQIELALELNMPIQMHIRDAMDDALTILEQYQSKGLRAIFHCFCGTIDDVIRAQKMDIDFYYSFAGNITFKSANNLNEAIKIIPINKILCETDAPYLTPVPMRGKINYPYYVIYVYDWISKKLEINYDELVRQIFLNNVNVFNLKQEFN